MEQVRDRDLQRKGILAQLGEHLPYKQRVIGSSPIGPITTENVVDDLANAESYLAG